MAMVADSSVAVLMTVIERSCEQQVRQFTPQVSTLHATGGVIDVAPEEVQSLTDVQWRDAKTMAKHAAEMPHQDLLRLAKQVEALAVACVEVRSTLASYRGVTPSAWVRQVEVEEGRVGNWCTRYICLHACKI
jgi:hypothetical protein